MTPLKLEKLISKIPEKTPSLSYLEDKNNPENSLSISQVKLMPRIILNLLILNLEKPLMYLEDYSTYKVAIHTLIDTIMKNIKLISLSDKLNNHNIKNYLKDRSLLITDLVTKKIL